MPNRFSLLPSCHVNLRCHSRFHARREMSGIESIEAKRIYDDVYHVNKVSGRLKGVTSPIRRPESLGLD